MDKSVKEWLIKHKDLIDNEDWENLLLEAYGSNKYKRICDELYKVGVYQDPNMWKNKPSFNSLDDVVIPQGVTEITRICFAGATLKSIQIPSSVKNISCRAFESCKTDKVDLRGGVSLIDNGAFGFSSIPEILLGDALTILGYESFSHSEITSIDIPGSVKEIQPEIFAYCNKLKVAVLREGITSLSEGMFLRCPVLTDVTIPQSVKSIGPGAFAYCNSLHSITFKGSMGDWNSIEVHSTWKEGSNIESIRCSNGTIHFL